MATSSEEAAEFFDPIQGAVANCYFIAAMASVAWAHPYMIEHLTRATGTGQQQFKDMIRFYDIDHGNAEHDVEVTEATIVSSSTGLPIYCRSSEPGEIWPAVYEKAFAKLEDRRSRATAPTSLRPRGATASSIRRADRARPPLLRHGQPHSADELWNSSARTRSATTRSIR